MIHWRFVLLLALLAISGFTGVTVVFAASKPVSISISSPRSGALINTVDMEIKVATKNPPKGANHRYSIDGDVVAVSSKRSIRATGLVPGEHTVRVEMLDNSGSHLRPPVKAETSFRVELPAKPGKVSKDAFLMPATHSFSATITEAACTVAEVGPGQYRFRLGAKGKGRAPVGKGLTVNYDYAPQEGNLRSRTFPGNSVESWTGKKQAWIDIARPIRLDGNREGTDWVALEEFEDDSGRAAVTVKVLAYDPEIGGLDGITYGHQLATRSVQCDIGFALMVGKGGPAEAGGVTAEGGGIDCGANCSAVYQAGSSITLTAKENPGFVFEGWSAACSGREPCTVHMIKDQAVTANFGRGVSLLVGKSAVGGNVKSEDSTIDCGADCSEVYLRDTPVRLHPMEDRGFVFSGWTGDCSGLEDCLLTLDKDKAVTANFVPTVAILVGTVGDGKGRVTSDPQGIDCPESVAPVRRCAVVYPIQTRVLLTAKADLGFVFEGWTGDCSGRGECILELDKDRSVSADFRRGIAVLVGKGGKGTGKVTSRPPGIDCGPDCSEVYPLVARLIFLEAQPDPPYFFDGWTGDCSGRGACVLPLDKDKAVTADFGPGGTVRVVKRGNGTGTVKSDPPSIDCGKDCSEIYPQATFAIQLVAEADPGNVFEGWTGPCGGREGCALFPGTFLGREQVVTANFGRLKVTLEPSMATVEVGKKEVFSAKVTDSTGAELLVPQSAFRWSTDPESIARVTVSDNAFDRLLFPRSAFALGLAPGTAVVYVWYGNIGAVAKLTVRAPAEAALSPPTPKPADLTVLPVSFSPRNTIPEGSISVSFTVKNQGESPSGPFSNRISLATTRYGTDISLGSFSMGSLAAGASQPSTVSVTIPASVTPGTYWVTVFTDGLQAISEADENNNIGSTDPTKITVFPPTPATLTVNPSSAAAGAVVTVTGEGFTPASLVSLTLGGVTVSFPVTEANGSFTVQITVPAQLGPGPQVLAARDSIGQSANTLFTVGTGASAPPLPGPAPSSACNNPYENTSWSGTLNLSFYGEATYNTTIQFTFGPARSGDCETVPVASAQVSDSSRTWRLDTAQSSIGCLYHRSAPQGTGAYARCETIEFNLKLRLVSGPSGVGATPSRPGGFTIDPLSIRIRDGGSNVLSTTQIKGPGGAGCCEWGTFSATRR